MSTHDAGVANTISPDFAEVFARFSSGLDAATLQMAHQIRCKLGDLRT